MYLHQDTTPLTPTELANMLEAGHYDILDSLIEDFNKNTITLLPQVIKHLGLQNHIGARYLLHKLKVIS